MGADMKIQYFFINCLVVLTIVSNSLASSFEGDLLGISITDSAKSNSAPIPLMKYVVDGNQVMFDATGSNDTDGSVTNYNWDFGDGSEAVGGAVNHEYLSSGIYSVTLTVTDDAGGVAIIQKKLNLSTAFYWSVDSLPQESSIVSDIGNIAIAKYKNDATLALGVKGNCLQQTDTWQTYTIPMDNVPMEKGIIRMYVKHDFESLLTDNVYRYFFRSENQSVANSISAYTYKGNLYFYFYDSAGTVHRTYAPVNWQVGTWYLYEFLWDQAAGLTVKQNGNVIASNITVSWEDATPNWGAQKMFFGYSYPLGSIDEINISN